MEKHNGENKIENIIKIFLVSRRNSKYVRPERITLDDFGCDVLAVFPNRKNAKDWIKFWDKGEDQFDIFERKIN